MGIASVFSSLVKGVAWSKVASMAIEYAPELYRKALERFQSETPPAAAAESELRERLARLEKLLLEQEDVIRTQAATNGALEKRCLAQEKSLLALKITSGILAFGCIILLAVIFR
jgi:hypothetical protein